MTRNILETLLGAVVLIVAIGFLAFAYSSSQINQQDGYQLVARFDRVDGLEPGSDVRVSGIKVGSVLHQTLDPQTYRAEVRFTVRDGVELPADSSASVVSNGLLGGKYLRIVPGGDIDMLRPGDEVMLTQSAISLEDLIGHMVFGQGSSNPDPGNPDPGNPDPGNPGPGNPGPGNPGPGNPALGGGATPGEDP